MSNLSEQWDEAMLLAYVDGELPPAEARRIERVLRTSPEAAELVHLLQRSGEAARGAFTETLAAPVPERLLQAAGQGRRRAAPAPAPARRAGLLGWLGLADGRGLAALGAAAAAALVLGIAVRSAIGPEPGTVRPAEGASAGDPSSEVEASLALALEAEPDGARVRDGDWTIVVDGPVEAGLGVPCRRFAIEGAAGTAAEGVGCKAPDGSWNVLTVPRPAT